MKRGKKTKIFSIFLCLLFGLILFPKIVDSATIVGVSPGNIYFNKVLRGGYAERYITMTVDSAEPVKVNFKARGEIKDWLNFQNNLSISRTNPGRLLLSVRPPTDIPNGNYSGFLRVATEPLKGEIKEEHATSTVSAVIDVAITVEITDLEILGCNAKNFRVNSVEEGDNIIFQMDVFNEGNIRLKPDVLIDIWDQDQISVVKSVSLKGREILPTREETLNFSVSSRDLKIDQYWVDVNVPDCLASSTLTFDVLEQGALKAEGILLDIFAKVWADVGETLPIVVNFKNTGEKDVDAWFKGQITYEGKIIQILESEKTNAPINEITNFTFFFTPKKTGKYVISGRVFYDKKRTFESSRIINAISKKFSFKSLLINIIYALLIIFIVFLAYKIRKERRRYFEKVKKIKG